MPLTDEQQAVIEASLREKSLVVNALAGSGKTSTAIECVVANNKKERKIAYLSFNKSVAMTMDGKLRKKGVIGPEVTTLHSLAFRRHGRNLLTGERKIGSLKPWHVPDRCLEGMDFSAKSGKFAMNRARAMIVERMLGFCGSKYVSLDKYLAAPASGLWLDRLESCGLDSKKIDNGARKFWKTAVEDEKLPLAHAVYLKLFHIELVKNPDLLDFSLVIIDEAQDLFPVTEALVRLMGKNGARLCFFGDRYQQIYTWNGSVNSIQAFEGESKVLALTRSFRCPLHVVEKGLEYLRLLGYEGRFLPAPAPCVLQYNSGLLVSRTNSSLLANIKGCGLPTQDIHLVGGTASYDFSAVADYLNLASGRNDRIKSPIIAAMNEIAEYEEYAEAANDTEMKNARVIVNAFGPKVAWQVLTDIEKGNFAETPANAKLCLSTGHKCKGSEFMEVVVDPSFKNIAAESIKVQGETPEYKRLRKLSGKNDAVFYPAEELRLAYVTLTRSTRSLESGTLGLENGDFEKVMEKLDRSALILTDPDESGEVMPVKRKARKK